MSMVRFLDELKESKVPELGGKGYSLAVLINNGFNVPKGFVIISDSFFKYLKRNNLMERIEELTSEINENNSQEKSNEIRNLILNGKMPDDIAQEIRNGLKRLNDRYISVRSSGVAEDSLKASFAGLFDTSLNVKTEPDLVLENVKKCWASLFNERAVVYRIRKNMPHLERMAVIIQEMIAADVAGTAFTAHPDTGDRNIIVVEATWGLGESLVSGSVTPDLYILDKEHLKIIQKTLGRKKMLSIPSSNGTIMKEVTEEKINEFCFSDENLRKLALICLKVEKVFEYPQDIEWCIKEGEIWLLQSRPITSLEVKI